MCRSIMSFGKITHKMWQDHPFIQTNKATKELWGAWVGGEVEEGWTKFEKKGIGCIVGSIFGNLASMAFN